MNDGIILDFFFFVPRRVRRFRRTPLVGSFLTRPHVSSFQL